jgi:hypothetical protein
LLQVGSIPEGYRNILIIILFTRKGKKHKYKYIRIEQIDKTPPQAIQTLQADLEQELSCYQDKSELNPFY